MKYWYMQVHVQNQRLAVNGKSLLGSWSKTRRLLGALGHYDPHALALLPQHHEGIIVGAAVGVPDVHRRFSSHQLLPHVFQLQNKHTNCMNMIDHVPKTR
jgi:hypothetical protein